MKFTRPVAALLAAFVLLAAGATGALGATTVEECQAQITALRGATADAAAAGLFTNAKSVESADAKLVQASEKLAAGKTDDAVAKLADFRGLLTSLSTAPKPKLDPDAAGELTEQALLVEDCIASIGTP